MSDGQIPQQGLRRSPGVDVGERQIFFPLRAIITKVTFRAATKGKRTLVNLFLYDHWPLLVDVPLLHEKMNGSNGVDWTPEVNDMVIVQFIGGNLRDPIVTGWVAAPGNDMECDSASEAPRFYRKHQGTSEKIQKDGVRRVVVANDDYETVSGDQTIAVSGNRVITVGEDETITVSGNGTVNVSGNVTINVSGTADISVDGATTINTPTADVNAETKITLNTPLVLATGNMQIAGGISSLGTYGDSGGRITTPGTIESTNGDIIAQNGDVEAGSISLTEHVHGGVSAGTSTTDAPSS